MKPFKPTLERKPEKEKELPGMEVPVEQPRKWYQKLIQVRYVQGVLLFWLLFLMACDKADMSIGIVAMTDLSRQGTFNWSMKTQSVVLSSFNWGFALLRVPSGELAARFGGMPVVWTSCAINGLMELLIPMSSISGGWGALCACRFIQGLAQGLITPAVHTLMGKWVPTRERNRFCSFVFAGNNLGVAIELLLGGVIADLSGWQGIFYTNGLTMVICVALYAFYGSSSPQKSKRISSEERLMIQTSLGQIGQTKRVPTPWRKIASSLPFLAVVVAHCGAAWGYWTLLIEIPSYMKHVYNVHILNNGFMSSLPYFGGTVSVLTAGVLSDYLVKSKRWSTSKTRKLCNSIGMFIPAVMLLLMACVSTAVAAIVLLIISVTANGFYNSGFVLTALDMSPNHAGVLMGISGLLANFVASAAPLLVGFIVKDEKKASEWWKVFLITALVYSLCNLFYLVFATSNKQAWNDAPPEGSSETVPGPVSSKR